MRVNLPMLKWGLRRLRAGRSANIRSVATREWTLCAEETAPIRPAIYLEGALDRISALSPWRSWDVERGLIEGGTCDHAASRAFLIEYAEISGPFVYRGGAKARHGFGQERPILAGREPRQLLEEAHLVTNFAGSHFFGNFVLDDFPLQLIPEAGASSIVMATNEYPHEERYRDLLSLPKPPLVRNALVRRLIVYTDFAQNSFKAARYRELRARMRDGLATNPKTDRPGVYLKRGATGERRVLANEADIEQTLEALGFDIVEPQRLSPAEIARRTLGARIIVSVEGSHLSHVIYTMADDAAFLVLQPPNRFAMPYKEFADRLDLRFAFLVCRPAEDDFIVDLDELKTILDKLL